MNPRRLVAYKKPLKFKLQFRILNNIFTKRFHDLIKKSYPSIALWECNAPKIDWQMWIKINLIQIKSPKVNVFQKSRCCFICTLKTHTRLHMHLYGQLQCPKITGSNEFKMALCHNWIKSIKNSNLNTCFYIIMPMKDSFIKMQNKYQ